MEIVVFKSDDTYIRSSIAQNITKRERSTVTRTSDSNYGFRAIDTGGLGYSLKCTVFSKFDGHFDFNTAIKSRAYNAYNDIVIDCSFMVVNSEIDDDSNYEYYELFTTLSAPFSEVNILPNLSYDNKPYDVFTLLVNKLKDVNIDKINPDTYFFNYILPNSGFTEILYDCSPTLTKVTFKSTIQLQSLLNYITDDVMYISKSSAIQLYEVLKKV